MKRLTLINISPNVETTCWKQKGRRMFLHVSSDFLNETTFGSIVFNTLPLLFGGVLINVSFLTFFCIVWTLEDLSEKLFGRYNKAHTDNIRYNICANFTFLKKPLEHYFICFRWTSLNLSQEFHLHLKITMVTIIAKGLRIQARSLQVLHVIMFSRKTTNTFFSKSNFNILILID